MKYNSSICSVFIFILITLSPLGCSATDKNSELNNTQEDSKNTQAPIEPVSKTEVAQNKTTTTAVKKTSSKTPAKKNTLPKELLKLEKEYQSKGTLSADFDQFVKTAIMNTSKDTKGRHTQGKVWVKIPGKLKWEVVSPSAELIVLDGKTAYHYTPPFDEEEVGQVLIQKASQIKSKLADLILQGNFSKMSGIDFKRLGKNHYQMTPLAQGAGDLKTAEFWLSTDQSYIQRLILTTLQGSRTEVVLKNVKQGEKLNDQFFHFSPPPGADIIRN